MLRRIEIHNAADLVADLLMGGNISGFYNII